MKVTIGGRRVQSKPGSHRVKYTSDRMIVEVGGEKAGRIIGAAMKNEVQADIRAIREQVSPETMEKREGNRGGFNQWLYNAAAGKKRKRKHIGRGFFANDTGRLADDMRVEWGPLMNVILGYAVPAGAIEMWNARPPSGRFDDRPFEDRYDEFRAKLEALCETLRDPLSMWRRPRVLAAIERARKASTKIVKVR